MEFITLNTGAKMPVEGFGVFQIPDAVQCEQVALRWNVQRGVSIIPKSVHIDRMEQNLDVWDFTLTDDEMNVIAKKDLGHSEIVNHDAPAFVKFIYNYR